MMNNLNPIYLEENSDILNQMLEEGFFNSVGRGIGSAAANLWDRTKAAWAGDRANAAASNLQSAQNTLSARQQQVRDLSGQRKRRATGWGINWKNIGYSLMGQRGGNWTHSKGDRVDDAALARQRANYAQGRVAAADTKLKAAQARTVNAQQAAIANARGRTARNQRMAEREALRKQHMKRFDAQSKAAGSRAATRATAASRARMNNPRTVTP